jgi:hypothetical protein
VAWQIYAKQSNSGQGKERQIKGRLGKASLGNARQCVDKQGKAKQIKAWNDKARLGKARRG